MPPREIDRCNHVKQKEYVPNIMRQKLDHTWNLQDYLDDKDWYEMGIDTKKKESGRAGTPGLLWELSSSGLFFKKKNSQAVADVKWEYPFMLQNQPQFYTCKACGIAIWSAGGS